MTRLLSLLAMLLIGLSVVGCDEQPADEQPTAETKATPAAQISPEQYDAMRSAHAEYRARNYEAAYRAYLPLAEDGVAHAQYVIGVLFDRGRGVESDYEQAYLWYLRASEQGHSQAQYDLAINLYYGYGAPADMDQEDGFRAAARWFRESAERGYGPSHDWLGQLYMMGRGVPKSVSEAAAWFERGVALDDPDSLVSLAGLQTGNISSSRGIIPVDDEKASRNFLAAARMGNGEGVRGLLHLYVEGRTSVPFEEILQMLEQTARDDDHWSQSELVDIYLEGRLMERDPSRAAFWLEKLTHRGFTRDYASARLAEMHLVGDGVPKDSARAAELLLVAVDRDGFAPGVSLQLSELYETGDGLPQDYVQAYYWAEMAVDAPHTRNEESLAAVERAGEAAMRLLGIMTEEQVAEAQRLFDDDEERRARVRENYQRSLADRWRAEDAGGGAK